MIDEILTSIEAAIRRQQDAVNKERDEATEAYYRTRESGSTSSASPRGCPRSCLSKVSTSGHRTSKT